MRVSYNWLKEYVDLSVDAEEMGCLYTAAGLELDEVETRCGSLEQVVVAKVLTCEAVAGSDHLHLLFVDVGEAEPLSVVCGAPNIAAGQIVACAKVGAVLPGGFAITARKTFGITSCGMICSQQELGISEDHSGIWDISAAFANGEAPLGAPLAQALQLEDQVLVIELTPNRSDCLGMLNCAREAKAITGAKLTLPLLDYEEMGPEVGDDIQIEIKDPALCARYVARLVKGVKIGPSPLWMQNRLLAAGMRPINNVVDISNFVMLEMNQPLHTFDYQKLAGKKILVRASNKGETMQTLDGKLRTFSGEELLICDGEKPVCVAGIMGGMETEVTAETTEVLIEAACFHPATIRRGSRRLGLPSEASMRFEKGVDKESCDLAARRAAQLLVKYCGGIADKGCVDARAPQYADGFPAHRVMLRLARVNQILGTSYSTAEIKEVMQRLDFALEEQADGSMVVIAPSYRPDIERECDLIEEVARLRGYETIPKTLPVNATQGGRTPQQKLRLRLENLCADLGLHQCVNYAFISPKENEKLRLPAEHDWQRLLPIQNPLSEEQSVMRRSLLPGLLHTAARNLTRRSLDLRFFEVGTAFVPAMAQLTELQPEEIPQLALLLGGMPAACWQGGVCAYDYFDLKGIVEDLFYKLGLPAPVFQRATFPFLHPGRSAEISWQGEVIGLIGEIHPQVAEAYELTAAGSLLVAEIALPALYAAAEVFVQQQHELPKYPASTRDIAVIGASCVPEAKVAQAIMQAGGVCLEKVQLFDLYEKAPIPAGQRSLAYSLRFRAIDRTLTDEEVDAAFAAIVNRLETELSYKLR